MLVALEETELVPRGSVIMLVMVRGGHELHSVSDKVTVEANEQSHERQVVRRNVSLQASVVFVSKRNEFGRLVPGVQVVNSNQSLIFVSLVELLKTLSQRTSSQIRVCNSIITDFDHFLRVSKTITESVIHSLVFGLVSLHLRVEQVELPVVGPSLALGVPHSWTRFRVAILNS